MKNNKYSGSVLARNYHIGRKSSQLNTTHKKKKFNELLISFHFIDIFGD